MTRYRRRTTRFRRHHLPVSRYIAVMARTLAFGDETLRDELEQEGRIAVWLLGDDRPLETPRRIRRTRRAIVNRMFRHLDSLLTPYSSLQPALDAEEPWTAD